MNLAIPLLVLMLSHGAQKSLADPSTKPRRRFVGKSGTVWFVVDSTASTARVPIVDVFATATGKDLVLSFATMSGVRARLFVAPSTLSAKALKDFDVSDFNAGVKR